MDVIPDNGDGFSSEPIIIHSWFLASFRFWSSGVCRKVDLCNSYESDNNAIIWCILASTKSCHTQPLISDKIESEVFPWK